MTLHIKGKKDGYEYGKTIITRFDEPQDNTGIGFSILKLKKGETFHEEIKNETAWLLMKGSIDVVISGETIRLERESLFAESASAIHCACGTIASFLPHTDTEMTVYECNNIKPFAYKVYTPENVPNEHRGDGQVGNTCLRFVRTIFDKTNSDDNADLVLGEAITMQGRWSSYPPHHHPQPEIYHYRFEKNQGFGHAELGDDVLKVRNFDTVKIFGGFDHAQCAAPGYNMYYSWVIRHLPQNPYTSPEFTQEHIWIMDKNAEYWIP